MTKTIKLAFLALLSILLFSCEDFLQDENTKYDRPDWLAGKVFTQIQDNEELSVFASCIERVGYDTIINTSGSYTVFAPNNEAFSAFFQNHPSYNSVDDIPMDILLELVKYHIVQNPWTKQQLRSLDVYGWIDSLDIFNNKPRGFKRETLLKTPNAFYGVDFYDKGELRIVDSTKADIFRKEFTDSRKYAPLFFREYFDIYNLDAQQDYSFYFDRSFEPNDIYYMDAKIVGEEIFAENGFIYNIDRVVSPAKNAYQLLDEKRDSEDYSEFLELLNYFAEFRYNEEETKNQPGYDLGLTVDSLFDISYPQLVFDLTNEETKPPRGELGLPRNVTIRFHHGMIAPTNEALEKLNNEYFVGANRWGSYNSAPLHIQRILANSHLSINPIYPSDFQGGIYNGENDFVSISESDVAEKHFGSNATFIGVDNAIIPRAFSSITGPVYLSREYSRIMYAIEETGLLPALKRENKDYIYYIRPNVDLNEDSTLLMETLDDERIFSTFRGFGAAAQQITLSDIELRNLILTHTGTRQPLNTARKEFIKTLAGNYLIVNNETGEVSGSGLTTVGNTSEAAPNYPTVVSHTDNGTTFEIDNWFKFTSQTLYTTIEVMSPRFQNLMKKAGLANDKTRKYSFVSDNEFYTILLPTDEALDASGADTLTIPRLRDFLRFHFIQGEIIFTDGNLNPGYYRTSRIDESSTEFTTIFTKVYLEPGVDEIRIPDASGDLFYLLEELADSTNIMINPIPDASSAQQVFSAEVVSAVIHMVDKALIREELDTTR